MKEENERIKVRESVEQSMKSDKRCELLVGFEKKGTGTNKPVNNGLLKKI